MKMLFGSLVGDIGLNGRATAKKQAYTYCLPVYSQCGVELNPVRPNSDK